MNIQRPGNVFISFEMVGRERRRGSGGEARGREEGVAGHCLLSEFASCLGREST